MPSLISVCIFIVSPSLLAPPPALSSNVHLIHQILSNDPLHHIYMSDLLSPPTLSHSVSEWSHKDKPFLCAVHQLRVVFVFWM